MPDKPLGRWVVEHRVHWLDWFFVDLSRIGSNGAVWIVIALVLAFLWRRPWVLVTTVAAVATSDLLASVLKSLIPRQRPHVHTLVPEPRSHAFPSGHAATAFAGATVLAWFAPRLRVPAFVLAALIAYSRVYVGVHWPLDVIAGALLGWLVARALLRLAESRPRSLRGPRSG